MYILIFFLFLSLLIAVLQVSISLNKVELSVGESKFFKCTGKMAVVNGTCLFGCYIECKCGYVILNAG